VEGQRRHVLHRVRECGSAQFYAGQRLNILNGLNLGSDASILTLKGAPSKLCLGGGVRESLTRLQTSE
jgi:hypothetical protein